MKLGWIVLVVAAASSIILLVRNCGERRDDYMNRQTAALRQRTVPPGSSAPYHSDISRTATAAETSWEFDVPQLSWGEYHEWVKGKLAPDYRLVPSDEGSIAANFTKMLDGDAHEIKIKPLTENLPLKVRVTFRSYAN